jgi:hypothetical protein
MGGTGVALGVDGAAPFLNPATITRIGTSRLAFSSRFYRFSHQRIHDFHRSGPASSPQLEEARFADTGESRTRVHSVPDSVCYFFPTIGALTGRQRLSICLSKTEEQELSLKALSYRGSAGDLRLDQSQHFDVDWSRFHLGPTWGLGLSERFSIGAALLVAFTRYQHAIVASSVVEQSTAGTASVASYEELVSAFSWDIAPRIGMTYQLSPHLSLGASATFPLAHIAGGVRKTRMTELDGARTQSFGDGDFDAKPPLQLSLGLGAEWEAMRFEVDAFVTPGTSRYARGNIDRQEVAVETEAIVARDRSTVRVRETTQPVVNLAAGAEIFVARRLSLLAGIQTDLNALEDLDPADDESRLFRTRLNYYRAGAGVCSYTDFGDLMLGLRFEYGTGQLSPANTLAAPPALGHADIDEFGVMVVLAGSINWQSISQAAADVGEVVRGKASPPPATPPKPLQPPKRE